MNYAELIDEAGNYVSLYMKEHKKANLLYHNIEHTKGVVSAAVQIANHYQLNDRDFFAVVVAAWFHDLGYYNGNAAGHEERGATLADVFLQGKGVDAESIGLVRDCILATIMPQNPQGLLQQIVSDADLFHFGSDSFMERNKLLRKEIELTYDKQITKDDWRKGTITLLEAHHYHTDYCRLLLNDKKQENLQQLKQKVAANAAGNTAVVAPVTPAKEKHAEPVKADPVKKEKVNQPTRGIETMFRITSGNNQRLSDMADNKAHILITVNSIILSAIISILLRKLDESSFLTYPTFTLLAVSVITIVIAILATRPSIPPGIFTKADIDDKKVNLLFFGNFYKMNLDDYADGMRKMMADSEFLYGTLIKDVYSQGVVLGRKYRLLRLSYSIFMFGLILSALGFVLVFIIYT